MTEMQLYTRWLSQQMDDPDLAVELKDIQGNEEEIHDRFYRELEFGTAGLRGVIGAGTNRMNIYTVRRATQGLADYINEKYQSPKIAIAYDSRIKPICLPGKRRRCWLPTGFMSIFIRN